jgi:hypothetical protein
VTELTHHPEVGCIVVQVQEGPFDINVPLMLMLSRDRTMNRGATLSLPGQSNCLPRNTFPEITNQGLERARCDHLSKQRSQAFTHHR